MEIRVATKKDSIAITEVSTASFRHEAETLNLSERDLNVQPPGYDHEAMTDYMIEELTSYVIEQNDKIVGAIILTMTGDEYGRIDRVFIHPDSQGKGMGKALIRHVENEYPAVRIWELETSIYQSRNIHFYKQLGFKVVHESEEEVCFVKRTKVKPSTKHIEEQSCEGWRAYGINASHLAITNSNMSSLDASNCNFSRSRFRNINFREGGFSDLNLAGSYFHFVTMQERGLITRFGHSNLTGTVFHECNLTDVNLTGCNIEGMTIDGVPIKTLMDTSK